MTEFDVEAKPDQDMENLKAVLRTARSGCWARQLVVHETVLTDVVTINGEPIDL